MPKRSARTADQLAAENEELRARLEEAEETLRAIRSGEVDALVVATEQGERLFTLEGAEHSYRVLIEDMNEGAVTLSQDGSILYCNRRFAEMLKAPLEKVIGSAFRDWVAAESQTVLQNLLQSIEPQTHRRAEVTLQVSDGSLTSVYLSINDLRIKDSPAWLGVVVTDLTEHKRTQSIINAEKEARENLANSEQARRMLLSILEDQKRVEQALRESEAELRALFASMRDVVMVIDREGVYRKIAPTTPSLLVKTPEELLGKTLWDVFPAKQAEAFLEATRQTLENGQTTQIEYELKIEDRIVWFATSISPMDTDNTLWVARDITEMKQAEERLRESEARYRHISELISDYAYAFRVEADGSLTREWVTESFTRITGYTLEEMDERGGWSSFIHPDDMPIALARARRLFAGEHDVSEFRIVCKDGGVRWLRDHGHSVWDEAQGRIIRIYGAAQDITEHKRRLLEMETLLRIGQIVTEAPEIEPLLQKLLDAVVDALPAAEKGTILLADEAGNLHIRASNGYRDPRILFIGTSFPPTSGYSARSFRLRQPMLIEDARGDPEIRYDGEIAEMLAVQSAVVAPLIAQERAIGVIALDNTSRKNAFTPDDLRLLTAIASSTALSIQNARLLEETRMRLKRMQTLRQIDLAIASSFDARVIFRVVLDEIVNQLGVHAAAILELNPRTLMLEYVAGRGFKTSGIKRSLVRLGEGKAGFAALERRTVYIADLPALGENFTRSHLLVGEGFVAYYAIPLIAKGHILGVLELYNRTPFERNEEWLDFLQTLAGQAAIAMDNAKLFQDLEQTNLNLLRAYDETILGWSQAMDLRDKETEGHTQRVTDMVVRLARAAGMPPESLVHVRRGALLHDIGKIGVPDHILLKADRLTEEERKIMEQHPRFAFEMLSSIAYLKPALDIPYCHHEKWDGTGYPRGLKGEEIPLAARLFALADVYDALTSDRPYRAAWSKEKALEYIQEQAGTHFDPHLVPLFLSMVKQEDADS